jgi:hypothetical protein
MSSLIPNEGSSKIKADKPPEIPVRRSKLKKGSGLKHVVTIAVAAAADGLQLAFPPLWIPVSIVTALILFALWGWRWEILAILVPELLPVIDVLPGWVGIALYLTGRDAGIGFTPENDTSAKEPSANRKKAGD